MLLHQPIQSSLPEEIKPCEHMTNLVSRRSDNSLRGPAKLYTDFHVMTCPHCRAALEGLKALQARINQLAAEAGSSTLQLRPEEWDNIEQSWTTAKV